MCHLRAFALPVSHGELAGERVWSREEPQRRASRNGLEVCHRNPERYDSQLLHRCTLIAEGRHRPRDASKLQPGEHRDFRR
jgi:hypothetical protein